MVKFKKRGLIALVVATTLVTGSAGPAAAQVHGEIVGENAGVGYESAAQVQDNCFGDELPIGHTTSNFQVTDTGTYDGLAPNSKTPIASFVGRTEVQMTTQRYVISPEGTYTDCTLRNPLVPIRASITTPVGQTGKVSCETLQGTYTRRAFDVIEINLTGQCDVIGNVPGLTAHVLDQSTRHVIVGVQQPCSVPSPTGQIPEECLIFPQAGSYVAWDHVVLPN